MCGSTFMDSTNHQLCSTLVHIYWKKKNPCISVPMHFKPMLCCLRSTVIDFNKSYPIGNEPMFSE